MIKHGRLFSLVGPGKVGSSLAMALSMKGWVCKSITLKERAGGRIAKLKSSFPEAKFTERFSSMQDDFRILLIAVQDDEIQNVVDKLSPLGHIDWNSKVVLHVSGVKSVRVLSPLKRCGAATGALHPIAAFASEYRPNTAMNIYYDFFGDDNALQVAQEITTLLKSKLIHLRSDRQRLLLHIASSMASNSTVIAVRSAEELIASFVNPNDAKALMRGLLASTVRNLSISNGMKSLTGPLVRGDFEVIYEHIQALENNKTLLQFYKSWSLLGLELLLRDKHIREGSSRDRRATMKKFRRILENK